MRSRIGLIAFFLLLSAHLALLPVAEAIVAGPGLGPAPAAETSAQNNEASKLKRKQAAKKKKTKQSKERKQRRAKSKEKQKQEKPNQAKKQKQKQKRAQGATPGGPRRQTSLPRLAGGPLASAENRLAQAANPGDRYIVVFKDDDANSLALASNLGRTPGIIPTHVYEHALTGFAGYLTPAAVQTLRQDPRVASVTPDEQVFLTAQRLPAGVNRIDAELNPAARIDSVDQRVDVDIAIIDTGTDLGHPDLNVFAWIDCTVDPAFPGYDRNGHGTHVAGTAAALDNSVGVVGVAPGARIWSMRVMDDNGLMFDSYIIDCMDAAAYYGQNPFLGQTVDVVNMSLGAPRFPDRCADTAFNTAVCGMVAAGVTTVVAAGNNNQNAAGFNPANIDQVITVSALADKDGLPGGLAGGFNAVCQNPQVDDAKATFSNFGADVDLAAPGVDILSTFPTYITPSCGPAADTGYEVYPGTSMASPHVAGAAGLLLSLNPNLTPDQVKAALQASRENVAMPGDPDGINEGILNLGDPPPVVDRTGPGLSINAPASAKAKQRVTIRVNAVDPSGIARVELYLCAPGCRKVAQDAAAPYSFVRRHAAPGQVKYKVRAYDRAGNFTEKFKTIRIKPAN